MKITEYTFDKQIGFFTLRNGGYIFICGKISMAVGVENSLKNILQHIGNMDHDGIEKTFEEMKRIGRYQEDIFG